MSNEMASVGILKTQAVGVTVQRMGQTLTLEPGDPVFWDDTIVNNSRQVVQVDMPALHASHGDALLELAPNASARLDALESDVPDAPARTEVTALSEGVELYEVSEAVNTAVLSPQEGEFSGLVGAGLLAGGASASTAAGVIGAGVLGAAVLDGDDDEVVDTGNPTTPTDPTDPTDPPVTTTELTGLAGLLADVADTLDNSLGEIPGLGILIDGLTDLLGSGQGDLIPLPGGLADGLAFLGDAIKDGLADIPVLGSLGDLLGGVVGGTTTTVLTGDTGGDVLSGLLGDLTGGLGNAADALPGLEQFSGSLESMDTLPGMNTTDLSLASTVIPADLFNSIVSQITQIDLSLFGMNSQFDAASAAISPRDFTDFSQSSSPINSSAAFAESIVVQNADFA